MIGDLAGHKVRVSNPKPEHESTLGLEGVARHALNVEQGGLPTDSVAEEIDSQEVFYYVDPDGPVSLSHAQPIAYAYGELEQID